MADYAIGGRSWVAVDEGDRPVGYVIVDVVDGDAYIEQVSVEPDHQRAGIGRALIEQVRTWAADSGKSRVTLTTFADVPWNAPMYRRRSGGMALQVPIRRLVLITEEEQ